MSSSTYSEHDLDFGATLRGLRAGLKVFERYTLVRMLGRGGMGVVWLAHDDKLDLDIALKFLPENLVGDESALDELRHETRRCMKLHHTNIVHVYDLVDDASSAAIAMEFVDGKSLSALRGEKAARVLDVEDVTPILKQACEALTYAHETAKIVHHDLKPANLMLTTDGILKVMDFGIASSLSDSMSRHSRAGQPGSGTLPYMSPQQALGFPPSLLDDVYSLGATIYELFTGKPPFYRGNLQAQIETVTPSSMGERRAELNVSDAAPIPANWEKTVAACLDKETQKRPQSIKVVWQMLMGETVTPPVPATEPPKTGTKPPPPLPPQVVKAEAAPAANHRPLIFAALVVLVLAGVIVWWFHEESVRLEHQRQQSAEQMRLESEKLHREIEDNRLIAQQNAQLLEKNKRDSEIAAENKRKADALLQEIEDNKKRAAAAAKAAADAQAMQDLADSRERARMAEEKRLKEEQDKREQDMADAKSGMVTLVQEHLRTYRGDSSSAFADCFAYQSDYKYYEGSGLAPRSFIASDRQKYLNEYPYRQFVILNDGKFTYNMDSGGQSASVTYSYSYDVSGPSKSRHTGTSDVRLRVEKTYEGWKITSFTEVVHKR